ncbi:MAG: hypothetical protein UY48_C0051G0013 [Candidatus Gottesmanbacteria bacterium GW2011_GWB1_49_7]|uniref:NAD-dependent epimerase/dehydratase n=1 Tax=Candidatus Gottesmanbacteria bacterium GW2011_GWB1_49_7 TaxID=1618448 RepID=A0A0G1VTW0_9BACT|nr:MAG: hypothetical protein UY48_C0051G0013 [Candidatus Gottesmanbacteria bacterium GW2011_GWB1_49_7]
MPICGRGDIATALVDHPGRLFFASGVSNSLETRESEYQREKDLLMAQTRELQLVYFSSLAIFYSETRYTRHKMEMESLVKEFPCYALIRLGNITWGTNPNTLINALRARVTKGEPIEIRDTTRYVIDKPEFQHWMNLIPKWNVEMNITGQPMKVSDIVREYVL